MTEQVLDTVSHRRTAPAATSVRFQPDPSQKDSAPPSTSPLLDVPAGSESVESRLQNMLVPTLQVMEAIRKLPASEGDSTEQTEQYFKRQLLGDVLMRMIGWIVDECFPPGVVVHEQRWNAGVGYAFAIESRGSGFGICWHRLASGSLGMVVLNMPKDIPTEGLFQWMRRELRKEIERNLLEGITLDSFSRRTLVAWPVAGEKDGKPKDSQLASELDQKASHNLTPQIDLALDIEQAIETLAEDQRNVVRAYLAGQDDQQMAHRYGITLAAVRKRKSRAFAKIRKHLGDNYRS